MELQFTRLEDKLDHFIGIVQQGFLEIGKRFEAVDRRFNVIEMRLDAMDRRLDAMDQRFDAMDQRFDAMDQRFDEMDKRFTALSKKVDSIQGNSTSSIETLENILNQVLIEIKKIAVVTRYENDYPYLVKDEPKKLH